MRHPLTQTQIDEALTTLPGWSHQQNKFQKTFTFKNFREAISFIVQMAFYAEEFDHHPELSNVYNRVEIQLTTHDAGNKVTAKDIQLAKAIESLRL